MKPYHLKIEKKNLEMEIGFLTNCTNLTTEQKIKLRDLRKDLEKVTKKLG